MRVRSVLERVQYSPTDRRQHKHEKGLNRTMKFGPKTIAPSREGPHMYVCFTCCNWSNSSSRMSSQTRGAAKVGRNPPITWNFASWTNLNRLFAEHPLLRVERISQDGTCRFRRMKTRQKALDEADAVIILVGETGIGFGAI